MRLKQHSLFIFLFLLSTAATGWAAQPAKPAYDEKAVANFYHNKTVRIIVGFTAGGGYDHFSKLVLTSPERL